ncbi:hypothetical protein [Fodinibius sp.]|uniref:hypothetical protein n=1 Tax=Fodinibius sp. TaxID=1872440 RepID=UPI002ACDB802|nr:hypothetical protein [Fodinibius sp.]MDZ7659940.1 hypothetical protein [Fodinibius sp.]
MKKFLITMLLLGAFVGCMKSPIDQVAETITEKSLMKPITKLSSDEFMGRATGTIGELKTVDYLVSQLEEYGLQGGAEDSGFVQDVPLTWSKDGSGCSGADP